MAGKGKYSSICSQGGRFLALSFLLFNSSSLACSTLLLLATTESLTERLKQLNHPAITRLIRPAGLDRPEWFEVEGLPADAVIGKAGNTVFRHYVASERDFKSILESKTLFSGTKPYDEISPYVYKKIFVDLTGVCLTDLKAEPKDVRLLDGETYYYVDIRLPPETPLIFLEKLGRTILVPLPKRYPDWIQDRYAKYQRGDTSTLPFYEVAMCKEIEAREGKRDIGEIHSIQFELVDQGIFKPK